MNKKARKLIVMLLILLICCVAYFVVTKITSHKTDNQETEVQDESGRLFSEEEQKTITEISLKSSEYEESFALCEDGSWKYVKDSRFPLSQSVILELLNEIKTVSFDRIISQYDNKADFGLEEPKLIVTVNNDKSKKIISFSNYRSNDGHSYYMVEGDNNIYMTVSTLADYADKTLYDYAKTVTIPDLSIANFNSINFENSLGMLSLLAKYDDQKNVSWSYYLPDEGETAADAKACDNENTSVLYNYITEFCFNRVVNYAPDETALSECGLDDPSATVTILFGGYTSKQETLSDGTVTSRLVETQYTYKLFIGNKIENSDGEYYVRISCTDAENPENEYDSDCIFAMNSLYCKYFLEINADKLNGVASSEVKLLDDERLPQLTEDNLVSFTIRPLHSQGFTLLKDDDSWKLSYFFDYSEVQEEAKSSEVKKLLDYFLNSGYFKYGTRYDELEEDTEIVNQSGLKEACMNVTVRYYAGEGRSESDIVEWTLNIGNVTDEGKYFVSASNSKYVHDMKDGLPLYLLSLKLDSFKKA